MARPTNPASSHNHKLHQPGKHHRTLTQPRPQGQTPQPRTAALRTFSKLFFLFFFFLLQITFFIPPKPQLVAVFWLVELDLLSLKDSAASSSRFWSVHGFSFLDFSCTVEFSSFFCCYKN